MHPSKGLSILSAVDWIGAEKGASVQLQSEFLIWSDAPAIFSRKILADSLIWVADQCASFSIRCSHSVYSVPTGLSFVVRTAPDCALPAGNCQPSLGLKRTSSGKQSCR